MIPKEKPITLDLKINSHKNHVNLFKIQNNTKSHKL